MLDDDGRRAAGRTRRARSWCKLPLPPGALADALERRRALPRDLPDRVPGLLPDRRRRLRRRGRLRLRDGAHRRHHQRRRSPPLDRRDRGGAGRPPRRRRVRRRRRRRRPQGPAPARLRRPEGGRRARRTTRSCARSVAAGARPDRPRGRRSRRAPSSSGCRRRAPARSCAARCARIADGGEYTVPATIDDPAILDEITTALEAVGYGAALARPTA